ncbi:hypothetical protein FH603_5295 [Spirosoma sp. LMG 31447]|uniref:Uncharacterized protein n=1 Tax=Spirosoma utsteinense TaxID=2585773 RepID=A0ABR6WDX8_9BACT|nr:hypothetical protein [Spirosoma utsteinense]
MAQASGAIVPIIFPFFGGQRSFDINYFLISCWTCLDLIVTML